MNNTNSFNISAQKNSNVYYCGHYFNANIGNSLAGYMNSKPNIDGLEFEINILFIVSFPLFSNISLNYFISP